MKNQNRHFYKNLLTLLLSLVTLATSGQTPNAPPKSLNLTLQEILLPTTSPPTEQGPGWKKWTVDGKPWNILLATSTGKDPTKADLVVALRDTLPLIALAATNRKDQYDYLKVDRSLAGGRQLTLYDANEDGVVDRVETGQEEEKLFVFSQKDNALPQFLTMPQTDGTYAVLSWDRYGDSFENILLYDPWIQSIRAYSPFTLNPAQMKYLFLKTDAEHWLELTYRNGRTIAVARHHQYPGNLESVMMDLNKDGKMDMLSNVSALEESMTIRKINEPLQFKDSQQLQSIRKNIVEKAAVVYATWRALRPFWLQLNPLGVRFPEVVQIE